MPEFVLDHGTRSAAVDFAKRSPFYQGYVEAAFFTSTGTDDDEGLRDATTSELAPETVARMVNDCATFQRANAKLLEEAYGCEGYDETMAGRDFWYTRNGHGVGFWCRDELETDSDLGTSLAAAAGLWRECDLYRGDDGLIYLS